MPICFPEFKTKQSAYYSLLVGWLLLLTAFQRPYPSLAEMLKPIAGRVPAISGSGNSKIRYCSLKLTGPDLKLSIL